MKLHFQSNSQGGTTYLQRVLKVAQEENHVDVIVDNGPLQIPVYYTVRKQLDLLKVVRHLGFTFSVTMEE